MKGLTRTIKVDDVGNEIITPGLALVGEAYEKLRTFAYSNGDAVNGEDTIDGVIVSLQHLAIMLENSSIQINSKGDKINAIHINVNG